MQLKRGDFRKIQEKKNSAKVRDFSGRRGSVKLAKKYFKGGMV